MYLPRGKINKIVRALSGMLVVLLCFGLFPSKPLPNATVIYCTSSSVCTSGWGSSNHWTVPADWNSANNTIEVIGGGGGGGRGFNLQKGGNGGGGGGYAIATNVTLTPGASIEYAVGAAGAGGTSGVAATDGGDTWI